MLTNKTRKFFIGILSGNVLGTDSETETRQCSNIMQTAWRDKNRHRTIEKLLTADRKAPQKRRTF